MNHKALWKSLAACTSKDPTRKALHHVQIEKTEPGYVCVSTDGHQIALCTLEDRLDLEALLLRGAGAHQAVVDLVLVHVEQWGDAMVTVQGALDQEGGPYPKWRNVFPGSFSNCPETVPRFHPDIQAGLMKLARLFDKKAARAYPMAWNGMEQMALMQDVDNLRLYAMPIRPPEAPEGPVSANVRGRARQ